MMTKVELFTADLCPRCGQVKEDLRVVIPERQSASQTEPLPDIAKSCQEPGGGGGG